MKSKIYMLEQMLLIRMLEEEIENEYSKQEMRCPVHLSIGQEAIAVGVCSSLSKEDYLFSTHRSHAHYLAKGGNLPKLVAEIYGRKTGCSSGKGGSMHVIDLDVNFLGSTAVVGGTLPLALGTAFGSKLKKEKKITCVFFGDGATETGVFYECLNFASLKNTPILFVCENNKMSVNTELKYRQSPSRSLVSIAKGMGLYAEKENGNDVEKVYSLTNKAISIINKENKPVFLEFDTYRIKSHVGPGYDYHFGVRSKQEIIEKEKHCPIKEYENKLIESNSITTEEINKIKSDLKQKISEAFAFAKNSPFPDKEALIQGVYR